MLTELNLITNKIQRLGSEGTPEEIAFLTTLITCGGVSNIQYGVPWGFGHFQREYGEPKFVEVKQGLVEEGLVRDSGEYLALNYPDLKDMPPPIPRT